MSALLLEGSGGPRLLPLAGLRELAPAGALTPLPGAPPAVLGLATVRGEVLTVVASDGGSCPRVSCLAVVEAAGVRFALGLERVPRASPGPPSEGPAGEAPAPIDLDALAASVFDLAALRAGGASPTTREEP